MIKYLGVKFGGGSDSNGSGLIIKARHLYKLRLNNALKRNHPLMANVRSELPKVSPKVILENLTPGPPGVQKNCLRCFLVSFRFTNEPNWGPPLVGKCAVEKVSRKPSSRSYIDVKANRYNRRKREKILFQRVFEIPTCQLFLRNHLVWILTLGCDGGVNTSRSRGNDASGGSRKS